MATAQTRRLSSRNPASTARFAASPLSISQQAKHQHADIAIGIRHLPYGELDQFFNGGIANLPHCLL